ncbi:hypothetical protein [Burkholderia pseudomallei]|uniref:hypothetical protein n=1 Tax=Burkholderia pseudomallei TaxID=28450 RepID=UPI0015E164B3
MREPPPRAEFRQIEVELDEPPGRLVELDLDLPKFRAWGGLAQSLLTPGRSYAPSGRVRAIAIFWAIPPRGAREDRLTKALRRRHELTAAQKRILEVSGDQSKHNK